MRTGRKSKIRRVCQSTAGKFVGSGAGRLRRLRLIELPAAVPALLSGARVSSLLVVPGAVAAELVGATDGLGRLL
ncbi:MAG: ABC transporter permease subunit, partial [Comamonadaceae bacterium]